VLTGQILLQLIVILLVAQIFGYLCKRIGQPWVIGEILAGLALGPTLLGALLPKVETTLFPISALPTLQTLGDIGLVLYIFSLGARIDTHVMVRLGRKALVVSLGSMILPLAMGTMLAFFLYPGLAGSKANLVSFMLLVGTALAITAFPVLARILTERNILRTNTGMLALTCAAAGDVVAWCLLALVIAIIHAKGLASAAFTVGLTVLFMGGMLGVLRPLLLLADRWIQSKPLLLALGMILLLLSAYTTNAIGIHPVFGAFLMGIILPRRTMFIAGIDQTNNLLFLPLYFVYSGLRTQIGLISSPALWLICLLVLVIACVGKIFGGMLSARLVGEPWKEALTLGVLMNTRGLVELIVLNIGLDLGVLSPTLFAMLVIMAVITTMMAPPLLPLFGYPQKSSQEKGTANEIEEIVKG
jgi:Kef-type K+ transport system membrane component KefB